MLTQTLFELNSLSTGCSKSGVGRPKIFFFLPLLATLDLHFNSKKIRRTPKTNFFVLELLGIILNTALSQHCFYTKTKFLMGPVYDRIMTALWQYNDSNMTGKCHHYPEQCDGWHEAGHEGEGDGQHGGSSVSHQVLAVCLLPATTQSEVAADYGYKVSILISNRLTMFKRPFSIVY